MSEKEIKPNITKPTETIEAYQRANERIIAKENDAGVRRGVSIGPEEIVRERSETKRLRIDVRDVIRPTHTNVGDATCLEVISDKNDYVRGQEST